jgi:hypothetical protein
VAFAVWVVEQLAACKNFNEEVNEKVSSTPRQQCFRNSSVVFAKGFLQYLKDVSIFPRVKMLRN